MQLALDSTQHPQHLAILLLGKQVDLKVQMISPPSDPLFMVLRDQDEGGDERPHHDDVAVREVDQPHGAVDDREPHGHQRIDRAEPQAAD